jgi:hypothetical protein
MPPIFCSFCCGGDSSRRLFVVVVVDDDDDDGSDVFFVVVSLKVPGHKRWKAIRGVFFFFTGDVEAQHRVSMAIFWNKRSH